MTNIAATAQAHIARTRSWIARGRALFMGCISGPFGYRTNRLINSLAT